MWPKYINVLLIYANKIIFKISASFVMRPLEDKDLYKVYKLLSSERN
jgi:hypothetical protein